MRVATLVSCLVMWILTRVFLLRRSLVDVSKLDIRTIVVLAWGGIGNVILLTPALKGLRKNFPRAAITVVVNPGGPREVLEGAPWVDSVIEQEDTGLRGLREKAGALGIRERNSLFLCAAGIDPVKASLYGLFAGCRYRCGELGKLEGFCYTHAAAVFPKRHEVLRNLDLLRRLGIPADDDETSFWLPEESRRTARESFSREVSASRGLIGMSPGSGIRQQFKRWPEQHFIEVAKWFASRGFLVVLLGNVSEKELCERIKRGAGGAALNAAGQWSLRQTAAVIAETRMMVSNDNGLMHIAAAMKVPVIAIFGPTLAYKNSPWKTPCRIVISGLPCIPCYNFQAFSCPRDRECLNALQPSEVICAIEELAQEQLVQLSHAF